MVLGIGEGVPIPIPGRAVPPRGHGVGTVWAGKESIVGPVAMAGGRVHRPGARSSWSAPGSVLVGIQARAHPWSIPGSAMHLAALGFQVGRRWWRRSRRDIEHQVAGPLPASLVRWALCPADQIQELALDRDQGPSGRDPILGRGAGILGEFGHFHGATPEPERHRARFHGPSKRDHHLPPLRPPGERFSIIIRNPIFQTRHDVDIQKSTPISTR